MRAFSQLVQNVDQLNDFLVTYRCCADKRYLVQLLSTQSRDTATELIQKIQGECYKMMLTMNILTKLYIQHSYVFILRWETLSN